MSTEIRDFLALRYEDLEERDIAATDQPRNRVAFDAIRLAALPG